MAVVFVLGFLLPSHALLPDVRPLRKLCERLEVLVFGMVKAVVRLYLRAVESTVCTAEAEGVAHSRQDWGAVLVCDIV